jgi:ketopantoate reductase
MDALTTEDLEHYRRVIQDMLRQYATFRPSVGDVQIELILDTGLDHYELIYAGWNGPYRIHGSVLHLDIRGGKVWIQHDGTEVGIASELVEAGIPADRIVLAFKPPEIRPYTGFAAA